MGFPHPNQFPYALAWQAMEEIKLTGLGKNEKQGNENWGKLGLTWRKFGFYWF